MCVLLLVVIFLFVNFPDISVPVVYEFIFASFVVMLNLLHISLFRVLHFTKEKIVQKMTFFNF